MRPSNFLLFFGVVEMVFGLVSVSQRSCLLLQRPTSIGRETLRRRLQVEDRRLIGKRRRTLSIRKDAVSFSAAATVATSAVLRLLTLCGIGVGYAKLGILDKDACAVLSKLIYYIFQPAMLFSNCAATIARSQSPMNLAALPISAAIHIGVGTLFASIALSGLAPKEKKKKKRFYVSPEARQLRALCAFGNAGPLPFVFAQGFFAQDAQNLAAATAYISFYLVGWSPIFWTVGPAMLRQKTSSSGLSWWRKTLSPPVLASLLGVIVGTIPFLYPLFLHGPLADGLILLGRAYLPAVSLVLAGTLARSLFGDSSTQTNNENNENNNNNSSQSHIEHKPSIPLSVRLALLAICRFLILPLASLALLSLPFNTPLKNDPLIRFVVFMASSMPSAQNAIVILQLDKEGEARAPSMARILALLYIIAILPMSLLLSFAAQIAPLDLR